jgi:hypothetical protein
VSNLWSIIRCFIVPIALAACSASSVTPATLHFDGAGSWTRVASSNGPFIYGAAYDAYVNIFTFSGQQVGVLKGFGEASGVCSDSDGGVFVLDDERDLIYEYLPDGSLPVDVFDDRYETPSGCAVDPITGDLAVANTQLQGHTATSNVAIFVPGSYQPPTSFTAPNISVYSFCAYDPDGNLYVDGLGSKQELELAELPAGSDQFVPIPLSGINNHHHKPAAIQWDGQYVAVGDRQAQVVYRVSVSGSTGTIVETVRIRGWHRHTAVNFDIVGKKLLFPLFEKLLFYKYPAGGRKTTGFLGDVGSSITVTSSQEQI